MTIKEFAQLCSCSPQTLRYYDRIDLLKPVQVDPWSGYRHYESRQAMDFVKIKNLQAADFTIEEIKHLLAQSDQLVYEAFDRKIGQQEQKLARIRQIQSSYLREKNNMEQIIFSMTDYILSQCSHPEVLTEFGLRQEDAPGILDFLRRYLNRHICANVAGEDISMTVNDEVVHGQDAVLDRIQGLTRENLSDTILLNDSSGMETEQEAGPEPDFEGWEVAWEREGWDHISQFFGDIPLLEEGYEYCVWVRKKDSRYADDPSLSLFLIGALLVRQQLETVLVNGAMTEAADQENYFKLLRKPEST